MSELSARARQLLYHCVTEYVSTGEPVGSRTLAKKSGLDLSPASIRNVLADLEDAGYLRQPHTSAGRVPTDRAFRLFIDALMQVRDLTSDDEASIRRSVRLARNLRSARERHARNRKTLVRAHRDGRGRRRAATRNARPQATSLFADGAGRSPRRSRDEKRHRAKSFPARRSHGRRSPANPQFAGRRGRGTHPRRSCASSSNAGSRASGSSTTSCDVVHSNSVARRSRRPPIARPTW